MRTCRGRQQPVGDGDAQHWREALDVQAIAQAQRLELILGQLTGEETARLVAELRDPLGHQGLVYVVVSIHGAIVGCGDEARRCVGGMSRAAPVIGARGFSR